MYADEKRGRESRPWRAAIFVGMTPVGNAPSFVALWGIENARCTKMPDAQFALGTVAVSRAVDEETLTLLLKRSVYDGARQPVQHAMVARLAKSDPAKAIEIAQQAARGGTIETGRDEISAVAELGFSRPDFAATWLQNLPEGEFRNRSTAIIVRNWSGFNPQAAATWVEQLPDGPTKTYAEIGLDTDPGSSLRIQRF